jgi:hypothetical protein
MIAIAFRKGPLAAFMFVIFPSIALAQEPNRPDSEKRPASNVAQAGRGYLTSLRKRVSDLRSNGRFDEAETILTRAAKEAEETYGPGDVVASRCSAIRPKSMGPSQL